jgi:hypothetical protein
LYPYWLIVVPVINKHPKKNIIKVKNKIEGIVIKIFWSLLLVRQLHPLTALNDLIVLNK